MSPVSHCLAVMYHYVRDRDAPPDDQIRGLAERDFTQQIDDVGATFEPIDWPMWLEHQTTGRPIPERSLLLTFDDGLSDHVDVVAPLLEKHGMRGLFFVSGRPIEEQRMTAAHRIHLLLCRLGNDGFEHCVRTWLAEHDPDNDWPAAVDKDAAHRVYHYEPEVRAVIKYLLNVTLPIHLRDQMTAELFAEHVGDEPEWARRWYGTWDQWAALQEAGHTIGGHGYRHERYLRLSQTEQAGDMKHIATLLADRLGPRPRPFSYPFGSYDAHTIEACAHAGFRNAFTTLEGLNQASTPAHELRRIDTICVDAFLSGSLAEKPPEE